MRKHRVRLHTGGGQHFSSCFKWQKGKPLKYLKSPWIKEQPQRKKVYKTT